MGKWFEEAGLEEDVVVSTRIRVARNLKDYKFPQMMNIEESEKVTQEVLNAMKSLAHNGNYKFIRISNLEPLDRRIFIEEHLISPGLIQRPDQSSFLLREDENITIMINEEDHLRIQVLLSGLNFEEGWNLCNEIDDFLEDTLNFAFHEEFGYLTSCPTNVGTGLRASAMVHVPSLVITGYINSLVQGLNKIGLAVRGIHGEGTKAIGNLYQISNQATLGEEEEEIIEKLKNVIYQIINKERDVRNNLIGSRKKEIEDKVFRSLGILKYSRLMTSREAMAHLSNVRLGKEMGIINDIDYNKITKLMVQIQPASIQKGIDKELTKGERDARRASLIRELI
ncbi:MAG: protein arginine kinase [Tissierellia bacterium]|nr:protein arginine kinase [Tissierellia bacterium]